MPFHPGQSGNLKGRPKGALDKRALLTESVLEVAETQMPEIVQKALTLALQGNVQAMRLCFDYFLLKDEKPQLAHLFHHIQEKEKVVDLSEDQLIKMGEIAGW